MARNFFDEIKQVIKDQTNRTPGLVGNLHGVIDDSVVLETRESNQSWYALQAETRTLPSLHDFIDAHSHQRLPVAEVFGISGVSLFPETGLLRPDRATLLWTSVNSSAPVQIPFSVSALGHTLALYVNGVLVASGQGELKTTLDLGAGQQFIGLIAHGGTARIRVDVPEEFSLSRLEPTPAKPILLGNPTSEYLKAQNGSYVVRVRWGNDPFASAWQLYRSEAVEVSKILSATLSNGVMTVRVEDDVTDQAFVQADFFTKRFYGGTILSVTPVTADTVSVTDIEIALDQSAPTDPSQWVNLQYLRSTEAFQSVARITYAGEKELEYLDTAVKQNRVFLYKVTAFGFITGTAESDYSESGWVLVGDLTPPGNVTLDVPNISVVEGVVSIPYTTPGDEDYTGVRVYLEDALDPTKHILVTKEPGLPADADTVAFRLPRAGKVWFRSYDSSDNIQPVGQGVSWDFDGDGGYRNSLFGLLTATVNEATGTVDLSLDVQGEDDLYPAAIQFFKDDLSTPLVLAAGNVQTANVLADGVIDKTTYAGLGGIPLPLTGVSQFWAKLTDKSGRVSYEYTVADRDSLPGGSVVEEDYLTFPNLTMLYDEDLDSIEIDIPNDTSTGSMGKVTYTRLPGGGLDPTDGGYITYVIGTPGKVQPGSLTETAIDSTKARGPYVVTYIKGTTRVEMWRGNLHGLPANPPTLEPQIVLDPTLGNAADVSVAVASPAAEQVTLEYKDEADASLPIWDLVTANNSSTRLYSANPSTISNLAWFKQRGANNWAQKLNDIPLVGGQVKRILLRVQGEKSGVYSTWHIVPLPFKEVPSIEGVDLTFDPATSNLTLTGTGGVFCKSAKFEFSADETFASGTTTFHEDLLEGAKLSKEVPLATSDMGKRWYGRVTPFNKAKSVGVVQGLGGIGMRDSEYVGDTPWGTIDLKANFTESTVATVPVDLIVAKGDLSKSVKYTVSETDYDYTKPAGAGTPLSQLLTTVSLGNKDVGKTLYVVAWFYDQTGATGRVSPPVTAKLLVAAGSPPRFGTILQTRDATASVNGEIRVDFAVQILDPLNRGGKFYAWTNKDGLGSADDSAVITPHTVTATPFNVTHLLYTPLNDVRANAQEPKFVTFEFVNSQGQSTGKIKVAVTAKVVAINEDGKITGSLGTLADGLTIPKTVPSLPGTGTEGEIVIYQGNQWMWYSGAWVNQKDLANAVGKLLGTQINDAQLNIAHFASSIKPIFRATTAAAMPANGNEYTHVYRVDENRTYQWVTSGTFAGYTIPGWVPQGDTQLIVGQIQTGQIAADAIRANHIKAEEVNATHIAFRTLTGDKIKTKEIIAEHIQIASLDAISQNVGLLVQGKLRGGANLSNYVDLNAVGTQKFIEAGGGFYVTAAGDAFFNGTLGATAITSVKLAINQLDELATGMGILTTGALVSASSGWWLNLDAGTNSSSSYDGYFVNTTNFKIASNGNVEMSADIVLRTLYSGSYATTKFSSLYFTYSSNPTPSMAYAEVKGADSRGLAGIGLVVSTEHFLDAVYPAPSTGLPPEVRVHKHLEILSTVRAGQGLIIEAGTSLQWRNTSAMTTYWSLDMWTGTAPSDGSSANHLVLSRQGIGKFYFKEDGHFISNSVGQYSPEPPKTRSAMTAKDWLAWSMEDAGKPVWPHKDQGLPSADHPEVKRRAKAKGRSPDAEMAYVDAEYHKELGKISIGTANWADMVFKALEQAKDFNDFKRRLGM